MARNGVLSGECVEVLQDFPPGLLPVVGLIRMAHFSLVSYH